MFTKYKAKKLVLDTIKKIPYDKTVKIGILEGGIAILISNLAAYYVKDNQVYAANGFAKAFSPEIECSKDEKINYDSVIKVCRVKEKT